MARFSRYWNAENGLLRALRLSGFAAKLEPERPKTVLESSRTVAASRCAVHVVPSIISVTLIILNLGGYFIGGELEGTKHEDGVKLGLLQVCAKVQELLIVASLTGILLHAVRHELIFGNGLPFGLLGCQFSFTQIQYFWSSDFIGALKSCQTAGWKPVFTKIRFLLLLFGSGLLAALAGPATALLMIPRQTDWPVGGVISWLNGSESDLWPTTLSGVQGSAALCRNTTSNIWHPACLSAGYRPIHEYIAGGLRVPDFATIAIELRDRALRKLAYAIAPTDQFRFAIDPWVFSSHSASAFILDAMQLQHSGALMWLYGHKGPQLGLRARAVDLASRRKFQIEGKVPAARVACTVRGNEFRFIPGVTETLELPFTMLPAEGKRWSGTFDNPNRTKQDPHDPERDIIDWAVAPAEDSMLADVASHIFHSLKTRGLIVQAEGSLWRWKTDAPAIVIIPISQHREGYANSLGLIILRRPNDGSDADGWIAATCSIDARWTVGTSYIEAERRKDIQFYDYGEQRSRNLIHTRLKLRKNDLLPTSARFRPVTHEWQMVKIDPSWFNSLAPIIPASDIPTSLNSVSPVRQSTMESLLQTILSGDPHMDSSNPFGDTSTILIMEHILAMAVVDGMSRCHFEFNLMSPEPLRVDWDTVDNPDALAASIVHNGNSKETSVAPRALQDFNSTKLVMRAYYTGYVMAAVSWSDYAACMILLVHALLALTHTVWVLYRGVTSDAWDTQADLAALCLVSLPPRDESLANTCGGVRTLSSAQKTVWVEVSATGLHDTLTQAPSNPMAGSATEELNIRVGSMRISRTDKCEVVGRKFGSVNGYGTRRTTSF